MKAGINRKINITMSNQFIAAKLKNTKPNKLSTLCSFYHIKPVS